MKRQRNMLYPSQRCLRNEEPAVYLMSARRRQERKTTLLVFRVCSDVVMVRNLVAAAALSVRPSGRGAYSFIHRKHLGICSNMPPG